MSQFTTISRRHFLVLASAIAGAGACAAGFSGTVSAEELPKLTEADATATALGYREDTGKVDATKFPTHQAGQACSNCKFFLGTDKTTAAGCQLFPGKAVAAKGWCSAYNAKT